MNNSDKEEFTKRRSFMEGPHLNQITEPPRKFKNSQSLGGSVSKATRHNGIPNLFYKSTNAYTKIVAKPGTLPSTPEIFQSNKDKSNETDTSDPFLSNICATKTFNTDISQRFSNIMLDRNKKKEKNKIKKVKTSKEKPPKEPGTSSRNKEKREKKKKKIQEWKELMKLNETNDSEGDISCLYENNMSLIDLYKVANKNALIFHMHHPSKFSFHGEIKVTIISGEVEILGYTLNSLSLKKSIDIYSPNFYTSLTVETKPVTQGPSAEELETKLKDLLKQEDCGTLLSKFKPNDSILYVEQIISSFGIVMNKYFDKQLFPKDLEDVSSANETLKSLQSIFTFQLTKKGKHFRKNIQWDKIPLGRCTILCGGKGVGKSTLLKYYLNKLVSLGEKVVCLDLDPGQPEFTFPGCVSAVIVDQPLLGPNFTHITEPIVMTCFGDVDVTQNPSKYLECVKYVIETCQNSEELLEMKWFVNTMGFCKGLGINLMITILKLLNPETVIQIKGADHKNNYPFYLTPSAVNSRRGYRTMELDHVNLAYNLRLIYSCAKVEKKQLQGGLKRRELRDIMSISYFSKMVSPPFYNFNAVQPYLISFSKLYLGIDFLIDPNDVLRAFNGSTVSLSHFEPDTEEIFSVNSEKNDYFSIVLKPKISPSFGIGFVRGIDCEAKKFYVITHIPIEALANVNCLSLGRVSPPHSMFLRQETVEGQTFYTTEGAFDVFQSVKRIFRVPGIQNTERTDF